MYLAGEYWLPSCNSFGDNVERCVILLLTGYGVGYGTAGSSTVREATIGCQQRGSELHQRAGPIRSRFHSRQGLLTVRWRPCCRARFFPFPVPPKLRKIIHPWFAGRKTSSFQLQCCEKIARIFCSQDRQVNKMKKDKVKLFVPHLVTACYFSYGCYGIGAAGYDLNTKSAW